MEINIGIQISDEVQMAATNCKKGFIRLNKGDLCKVEGGIDNKVYFIKCLNNIYCSYKNTFGEGFFCACPVRNEIFNKYQIYVILANKTIHLMAISLLTIVVGELCHKVDIIDIILILN